MNTNYNYPSQNSNFLAFFPCFYSIFSYLLLLMYSMYSMYSFTEVREKSLPVWERSPRFVKSLSPCEMKISGSFWELYIYTHYTSLLSWHLSKSCQLSEITKSPRNENLRKLLGTIHLYTLYIPLKLTPFEKLPTFGNHQVPAKWQSQGASGNYTSIHTIHPS
jgi:hypothetical protein